MRVLVVDDSIVFRSSISNSLKGVAGIEVVGTAANGKIAIEKLRQESVDLVTLDMEMPEMNGIETLKAIRAAGYKVKVIVFSSQTTKGAETALEALREGADDVIAKPVGEAVSFENAQASIAAVLIPKISQFMERVSPRTENSERKGKSLKKDVTQFKPGIVVIASSTGGPNALEHIFGFVKDRPKIPILIVQHMPPVFTQILAKRLSELTGVSVSEAVHGKKISPGEIWIAPGDFHMLVKNDGAQLSLVLNQAPQRNSVRPAADHLFESVADILQEQVLGIVLTGMGEDGLLGARQIRSKGGRVLIQNKESCVVFGMPGAIYDADEYDSICDLNSIGEFLQRL